MTGSVASALPDKVRVGTAALAAAVLVVIGVVGLRKPLQWNRETSQTLMRYGPVAWAACNGSLLGLGFASRIGFWLWYLVPVSCWALASPAAGGVIWGVYGLTRMGIAGAGAWRMHRRPDQMAELSDRLLSANVHAHHLSRAVLVVLAAATALLVGL